MSSRDPNNLIGRGQRMMDRYNAELPKRESFGFPEQYVVSSRVPGVVTGWSIYSESGGVAYRWLYDTKRAWVDISTMLMVAKPGAEVEQRFNLKEFPNVPQGTGTQGNSVNQGGDYPAGFQLVPIGGGVGGVVAVQVPVMLFSIEASDGTRVKVFDVINADDGDCGVA